MTWPEAEIVAEPVKRVTEPRVLVRRRTGNLWGANGEDVIALPGLPAISLFTGVGGFDIGIEQAGFVTLLQHEMMLAACQTLIANRPNYFRHAALIQGDIRRTTTGFILKEAGLRVGECHLITGGPPCQGFSTGNINSLKGKYDRRNDLVYEFLRVIREAQPHFWLFENVPGFVRFNKGEYLKGFLAESYGCYYELVYGLLNAVEYGVPQNRCRFICMGTRRDLYECDGVLGSMPSPTHFGDRDLKLIKKVPSQILMSGFSDEELELIQHPPGIRYFPDREVICNPNPGGSMDGRSKTFLKFFKDLRRREPDRIVESLN
jgi:DNA (cytosine-5)-methyltransferase 1